MKMGALEIIADWLDWLRFSPFGCPTQPTSHIFGAECADAFSYKKRPARSEVIYGYT